MPSTRSGAGPSAATSRRYRRSAFNGAKQLNAVQAPSRFVLAALGLLALALVATLAFIVGVHLQGSGQ